MFDFVLFSDIYEMPILYPNTGVSVSRSRFFGIVNYTYGRFIARWNRAHLRQNVFGLLSNWRALKCISTLQCLFTPFSGGDPGLCFNRLARKDKYKHLCDWPGETSLTTWFYAVKCLHHASPAILQSHCVCVCVAVCVCCSFAQYCISITKQFEMHHRNILTVKFPFKVVQCGDDL